jgi:hypothetical protein
MNYNEGWNVMFTARLLAGGPLYVPLDDFPLTPMNYPPLSFAIIGGLSYFTGNILLTGRIVSLCSSLIASLLIFRIIDNVTGQKSAATFSALVWLGLMTRLGGYRLVMHDPQLMAHAFSLAALCLFSEWRDALTPRRICLIALLCCLALFVKHLVFVVPVVLAIALFFADKRAFLIFAAAGVVFSAIMAYGSWHYGGAHLLANFLDFNRPVLNWKIISRIRQIFFAGFAFVVFAPFLILLVRRRKGWLPYLLYFCLSFVLGAYATRGVGVDINAWFDFFIAAAIIFGIFTGDLPHIIGAPASSWARLGRFAPLGGVGLVLYAVLVSALLPLAPQLRSGLRAALNYDKLQRTEQAYRKQVELLRSIPGPALFESLLLGFDAGKEFLYEPFGAAQMMISGRIRETILTDAIRRKTFGAIVLEFNLDDAVCKLNGPAGTEPRLKHGSRQRWTDNTLRTAGEHYQLLDRERFPYYFYVPRPKGAEAAPLCPPRRDA